ncbi:putative terminase large subunit [Serratia phage vB_SmaS_PhooPhighters]|nr:putative terminase large subunit [Serratia phage vB_SmaS_PhooPhighters]
MSDMVEQNTIYNGNDSVIELRRFCKTYDNGTATVEHGIEYARDVVEGRVLACKHVKNACKRFLKDLDRCNSDECEMEFSFARAQHILDFAQTFCVHVKGRLRGKKVDLMDFHIFILIAIFGFIVPLTDDETGDYVRKDDVDIYNELGVYLYSEPGEIVWVRRYKTAVIFVARKNAKSFLASVISLYMLFFDDEGGAEIYSAATKLDQAKIVYDDAKEMVEKSPLLKQHLQTAKKSIFHIPSYSKFVPLASEADSLDGLNIHLGILDEIHAYKTRDLFDVIETATGSRDQPLILCVSTAGVILDGIATELCDYGNKINEGLVPDGSGDSFFQIFYTLDDGDDEFDELVWFKANPALGKARKLSDLREKAEKAKEQVSARSNYKTKYMNIFVAGGESWMDMQKWQSMSVVNAAKCEYFIGVDLANKIDLCAATKVYRGKAGAFNGHLAYELKLWLPEGRLKTCSKMMAEMYKKWAKLGLLTLTEGDAVDHETVLNDILEWVEPTKDLLQEVAYDSWQATQFAIAASAAGLPMVEVTQTVKNLSESLKHVEMLVYSNKFHHHAQANIAMNWMMSNVNVKEDKNENIFPFKSGLENKIDGPGSLFNAVSRIIRHSKEFVIPVIDNPTGNL